MEGGGGERVLRDERARRAGGWNGSEDLTKKNAAPVGLRIGGVGLRVPNSFHIAEHRLSQKGPRGENKKRSSGHKGEEGNTLIPKFCHPSVRLLPGGFLVRGRS